MRYLFTTEGRAVGINLLLDGAATLPLDGGTLHVTTAHRYEAEAVILRLGLADPPPFTVALRVRVPPWARRASVAVNGQLAETEALRGYVSVERVWQSGDRVEVCYPREVDVRRGMHLGQHVLDRGQVAVVYGPHVYCVSDRHNPAVRLHLARARWWGRRQPRDLVALDSKRLAAWVVNEAGERVQVVLTPLGEVGGAANGVGRSHPVSASPFRVWLPLVEAERP
jgi:DUF1680 family protein